MCKAFIRPHLEPSVEASSPILSRDCQALESVQKLVVEFVKGMRHVPYETALQRLLHKPALTALDPWSTDIYLLSPQLMDAGNTAGVVYFKFAKAFDSVNHRFLLTNIDLFGLCEKGG